MSENGNEIIIYQSDSSNFQPSTSRTSPNQYLDTSLTLAEKESLYSQPSAYGYEQSKYNIDPTKSKGVTWIFNHKAAYEAVTKTSEAEQHFYQLERSASKLSKLGYYDSASGRWTSKNKIVKKANRNIIEHSSITHATKSTYNRIIPYDLMHNDSEQDFFMAKPHRPKFAAFPTIEEYYSDKYRNVRNWANVDPCWFFKNGANITEQKERLLKAYKDTRQRFIDFLRKPELEKIENRRFIEIQPNTNVLFIFHHLEMHIMGFVSFFESPSGNIILWDCYHRHFYPMFRIVCQNNEIIIESDWTFQDKNFFKYCMLRGMHYLDRQSRFPNEIPKQDPKSISRETQQKSQSKDSKYGETRTQLEQKNAAIDCISETRFFPLIPYNIVNGQLSLVLPKNNLSYRTHTSRNALPVIVFPLIINEYAYEFFPNPNYVEYAIERRSDETDIEDDYILSQRSVQKYRMAYKIATPEDDTSREAYTLLFVELIENAERIHKDDAIKLNKGPIKVNTGNGKYTNLMNTVNTHHILQIPIKLEKILESKLENYRITYGRQAIPDSLKDLGVELSTTIYSASPLYKLNYSSLEVDNEPKMYTETRVLEAATPLPYADYIKKLSSRHSVSFGNIRIKGVTNVPEVTAYAEKAFSGAWQFSSPRLNLTPSPYRNRCLPAPSRQGTSSLQFIRLPQSEAAKIYFNSANNKRTTYMQSTSQTTPQRGEMHIRKELQQQRATTSRGEIYPKARITSMEQNRILSGIKSLKITPKPISSMHKQTEEADLNRKTTKELTPNTIRSLVQQIVERSEPNQNNSSNMTAAQIRNQYLSKEMPNGQPSLKRSLEKLPSIRGRKVARANATPKIINRPEESNQNATGRDPVENVNTIDTLLACNNELDSCYVQVHTNSELNTPESIKPPYQGKKRGRPRKVDAKPEIIAVAKPTYSNTRTRTRHCGKEVECEPLTQFKKSKINTTVKKRQSLRPLSEYASLTPLGKRLLAKYERESNEGTQYERNDDPDMIEDELVGLDIPNIGRPKKTSYSRGADAALKKKMVIAHIMLHGDEGVLEQWEKDAVNKNDRERLAQRCIDENIIITALNAKKPKAKYQSTSRFGDIVRKRKKLAGKIKKKGKSIILKSRSVRKNKEEGKKLLRSAMEARSQYALEGKQSKLTQTINVLSLAYSKGLVDIKEIHEVGKLKPTHAAIIFKNDCQRIDQDSSSNEVVASIEDRGLSSKSPSEIVYEYTNKEMQDLNFAMYATTFGIDVKWVCFTRKTFMMPMPSAFPEFYTKSTLIQFKTNIFNAVRCPDKIWSNKNLIKKETCLSEQMKQEIKSELKVMEVIEIESEQYEQLCSQYNTDEGPIDDSYYASYGYMGPITLSEEEIPFFYQNQRLAVAQQVAENDDCSVSQEDSEQDLIEEELQLEIVNAIEKIKRYNEFKEFWKKLTNLNETSPSYSDCLKKAQELLKEVQKELFQQDIIQIREKFTGIYIDSKSYEATQDKRRIFEQLDNFEQMRVEQEVGALEKKVERIISKKTREEEEAKETLEEILDQICESLHAENEKATQEMTASVLATIVPILEESGKDALHICQTSAPIVDEALPFIPKESAAPIVVETTVFGYDILESSDVTNAVKNTFDALAKISLEEQTTNKQTQAVEEPNIIALEKEIQQPEDVVPQETTIKSSVESDALNTEEISTAVKQSILLESDENESVLVGAGEDAEKGTTVPVAKSISIEGDEIESFSANAEEEVAEKETHVPVGKSISIEIDDVESKPALDIAKKETPASAVEITPSLVVVEKEMEQAYAEKEAIVIEKELEQVPTEKETLLVETEKSIDQQEMLLENVETSKENLALVKEIVKQLETKLSIEPPIVAENDELNKSTDSETARRNSVVLKLIENSVPIKSNVLSIGEQLNQSGENLFNVENIPQIPTEELYNYNTNLAATAHESNLRKRCKQPDSTRSGRFDDSTSGESDIDENDDRPKKIPRHIIKAQLPSTSRPKHTQDTYCANIEKDIGAGITVNAPNPDEFVFIVATKHNYYQRKRFEDAEVKEEIFDEIDEIEEEYHNTDNVRNSFEESDDDGHNPSFLDRSSDNEERPCHSEHSNSSLYDPIEDGEYQDIVRQYPTRSNSTEGSSDSSSSTLQVRYYHTPSPQNIEETNHETRNEFCHDFNKSPPFKSYRVDDDFGQSTSTHFAHRQSPRLVESDENALENDKTDYTTDHYDPDQPPGPGQIHILAEFEEAIDLESYHPPAPVNVMPNSPEICLRDMDESCSDSDNLIKIQARSSNWINSYALFLNNTKFIEEIKEMGYISINNENICCSPDNLLVKLPWGRQKVITKNKETTSFNPLPDTYNDPNAKPHFSHPDFDPAQKSSISMFDPMIPQNVSLKKPSGICQSALFDSFAVLEDPLNQWANPQLVSNYLEEINHLPLEVQLFALNQVNQYCPFIIEPGFEFDTTGAFDGFSERYPNANLKNFLHVNSKHFFLGSSALGFNQMPQPALTQQEVSACFISANILHQTEKIMPENSPKESDMFDKILQKHMPLPLSKAESQSFLQDLFYNVNKHGKKQNIQETQETEEQESPELVEPRSQTIIEMLGGQSEESFFENSGKMVDEIAQKSPIEKLNEESLYLQTEEMAKKFEPEKQILESEEQEPAVIEPEHFIAVQQFAEEQPYEEQYAWDGENMQQGEFEQIPDKLYQLMMRKRPEPNTPQDSIVQSWITTREELNIAGPVNIEIRLTDALRADTIQDVEESEFEETVLMNILNNEYAAELAEKCNIEEIPGQMEDSLPYIEEEFEAFTNSLKLLSGSDQRFNLLPPAVTLNMWKQVQILANYNFMDYNVHLFCYFVNMEKFRDALKVLEKHYEGIKLTSPSSSLERSPATWSYKALVANIVHQIGGKFVYSRTLETRHSDEIASFYEAEDPVIPIYELKTLKDQVTTLRKVIPDCVYEEGQAEIGSKDGLIYIAYVCEKIRAPNSHNYYEKVEDATEKLIGCHILTGVRGALLHESHCAPYIKLGPFRPFVCDPFNSQPLDIRLNRKSVGVKWDNGYKSPCDFLYYYGLHSPQDYSYYTTFICSPLVWKPISSHKDIIEEFGDTICENPHLFNLTSWNYLESTCHGNVQNEEYNVAKDFAHIETFEQRLTPPATNDEEVMAIDEEHDIVKESELIAEDIEERIINKKSPSPKLPLEMDDGTPIHGVGFCTSSDVEDNCSVTSKDFTPSDEDELSSIEADSDEELESRDATMEEDIMNDLNLLNEFEEYDELEKSQNTSSESTSEWISQFKKFFRRREKEFTSIVNFSEKIALFTNGDTNSNGLKFKVASAQMQRSKHFKAVIDVIWHYYIIVRVQSAFHMATIVELGFTPTGLIESLMSERNLDDIITEELKNLYESTHSLFNIDHYANLLEYVENKERAFANDSEENKKTFCDSLIYGIIQKTCVCPDLVRVLGKEATPPSWHSFPYLEKIDVKNGNVVINNGAKDLNFPDPVEDDFEFWSMEINITSIPKMVRFIAERVAKAALEKQHLKDSSSEELISKIEEDLRNPSVFFTKRGMPELEDFNDNIYSAVTYLVVKLYIRTRRFMKDQATIVEKQIVKLNAYWEELENKFSKPPESQIFFDNNPHSFGWKTLKLTESAKPAYKEITYSDDRSFESSELDKKKSKNLRAKRSRNSLPKVQEADGCDGDFSSDDADVSRDNLSEGREHKRGKQDLNDDNISLPSNSDYGSMHEELEVQSNVSLPSISSHTAIPNQAMTMQREGLFQRFLNDDDSGFATATSDDLYSPIKKYRSETSAALNKAFTIEKVSTDLMLPSLSGKESDLPALLRISTKQNLDEQIDINLPDPEFTPMESHQKIRIEVEDQKELNAGFNSLENKEQQPNIGYSSFGNGDVSDSPLSKFLNKNKKLLTRRAPRKRIFSKEDQLNTNDEHSATSSEVEDQVQSTCLTTSNTSWTDISPCDTKDNELNSEVSNSTAQLLINENTDEPSHVELHYAPAQIMKSLESTVSQDEAVCFTYSEEDEDHEKPISSVQPARTAGFIKEISESIKAPTIAELLSSPSIQIPVDPSKELIQAKYIKPSDVSFSPNITTTHESIIPSPIVEESKIKDPLFLQAIINTVNDSPYNFVYNEPEDNNALPLFPKIESPKTYPTHHITQQSYSRPEVSSNKAIIEILQRPPITDFNTPSRNVINDHSEVPHKIARTNTLLQEEQNRTLLLNKNQIQFNNDSLHGFPFVEASSSGPSNFADTMNMTDAHRIPAHRTTKKEAIKHGPVIEKEWPTGTMNIQKSNRCARGKKTNVAPTKEAKTVHRLYMSGKREMKMFLRGSKLDFEEMEKYYDEEVRKREEQQQLDETNRPLEIQEEYKLHIVNPQLINRPEGIFEDPVPPRSGMITRSVRKSMTQQPKRFIPMSHFENQTPIESKDSLMPPINDPQQICAKSEILLQNQEQLTQKTPQLLRNPSLEIIEVKTTVQRVQEVQAIARIPLPKLMELPGQKSPSPDIVTIAVVKKTPRIQNLQEGQDTPHIQPYKSTEERIESLRIPSLHQHQSALVAALSGTTTLITPSPCHAKDRPYLSTQVVEEHVKSAEELQNKDFLNLNFDSNQISSNVHAKKDVENLPQNAILQRVPPQERLKDYMSLVAIESLLQNEQPRALTPSDAPLDLRLRIPGENEKPSDLLLTSQRDISIPLPEEKIPSLANGGTHIPHQFDLATIIKKCTLNEELLLLNKCRSVKVRKLVFIPDDEEKSSTTDIIVASSTRSSQKKVLLSPQSQKEQQVVVVEKGASKDEQTISVASSKDKDSTIPKTREHLPPNLPPNVNVLTKAYFKAMSSTNEKPVEPTREMSPSSDDDDKVSTECITTVEPIKVQEIVSQAESSIQLNRLATVQRTLSTSSQTSDSDNDRLMICEDEEELVLVKLKPKERDKIPEKSISTPEISPQQTEKDRSQILNELPFKDPLQTEEISSKEAEQEDDDVFFVLDMKEELEKEARKKALVAYVTPKPELKILYGLQYSMLSEYWSSTAITLNFICDAISFMLQNLEKIFVSNVESTSSLVHISSTVVPNSPEDQKQPRLRRSPSCDLCIKMQPNLTKLQSEIEAQVKPSFPDFQLLESQIYKPSKFSKKMLKKIKTEVVAEQLTAIYKRAKRMKKMECITNIKARSKGKRRAKEKLKPMRRSLKTTKNTSQSLTVADDDYLF